MTFYVRIPSVNGRNNLTLLAEKFAEVGILDVEYHAGGWHNDWVASIPPHLKFENEEEATIYVLRFGGKIETRIPVYPTRQL